MIGGQHKVWAGYLHAYAAHAAWLEDHRRTDNGGLVYRALGLALSHGVSRQWKGIGSGAPEPKPATRGPDKKRVAAAT
jgi:hypothetical protein